MRLVLAALLGVVEATAGVVLVGAAAYLPLLGYYSAACAESGAGWALLSLFLFPVAFPPVGFLWFAAGVAVGLIGQPFHASTKFWSVTKWFAIVVVVLGVLAWILATATDATARCGFGF
jgi:ABC-type transport system involved in cytochrome c biogenesis permease component